MQEKSQILQDNVLRAYPPATPINPSKKRRVTPPQQRIVVPPSPPESLIISRQYRSASTATQATARTMPVLEESEGDASPGLSSSSLRDRLGKAFTMRRGTHSRKPSSATSFEFLAGKQDQGKLTLITNQSSQLSSPQSAQTGSANTSNLSALSTAHTSLYTHTFPITDPLPDIKSQGSATESQASFGSPNYYTVENASRVSSQCLPDWPGERRTYQSTGDRSFQSAGERSFQSPAQRSFQSPAQRSFQSPEERNFQSPGERSVKDEDRNITVKGGEVRVEIRRPTGKENSRAGFDDIGSGESSRVEATPPMRSARGSGKEVDESWRFPEASEESNAEPAIGLGIRTRRAFSNLRSQVQPSEQRAETGPNFGEGDDSEDYIDTVNFFQNMGEEEPSYPRRMKSALPYPPLPDLTDEDTQSSNKSKGRRREEDMGKLTPAKSSSSVLIDSSAGDSLNMPSQSSLGARLVRPTLSGSRNQSSSPSSGRRTAPPRPVFGRSLTGQTNISIDTTGSSSIALEDVEGLVRRMSEELSKRLSVLSSSGGSTLSSQGKVGGGVAIVVTADNDGSISEVRGGLLSISDDDEEEDDYYEYSSVDNRSTHLRPDKGKGREIPSSQGTSTGDTKDESTIGPSPMLSDVGVKVDNSRNAQGVLVHPGDERYNL